MKTRFWKRFKGVCITFLALLVFLSVVLLEGSRYASIAISASAASSDVMRIEEYHVDVIVREDRKIEFRERITMQALRSGSVFTRSLPLEGDRYSSITATCIGEEDFIYYVETDEDDDFLNIYCELETPSGTTRQYEISYIMEIASEDVKNGMRLDVIGFGWMVPLHEVTVQMHFPAQPAIYKLYTDSFGTESENVVTETWSEDRKTWTLYSPCLDLISNDYYNETTAGGLTVEFSFDEGVLTSHAATRIFTDDMWKIVLGVLAAVGLSVAVLIFTRNHREMVTIVNIKAPDEMDPMKMGKWLDGSVDDEDVTSMIYYFANKGYLRIDLTDENDPEIISRVVQLPESVPVYEKTLFNGLFAKARQSDSFKAVRVSEAAGKFYDAMQKAKLQTPNPPTMYENKSILGYIGGCVIAILLGFFTCYLMGTRVGGDYTYSLGIAFAIPVFFIGLLGYICENYRYKWKDGKKRAMMIAQIVIAVLFTLIFTVFFGRFIMTEWEKIVLCLGVFGSCFATQTALSRSEAYMNVLGDILGFKDFIVVTEEDKIKFMLEENPELYYKVLPYAQVLGVTDEWESKFQRLTLEPPTWYCGTHMTTFDHYIIHRSLNRAIAREIAAEVARRSNSGGGSRVGRSGGGGSFGGFGGGGRGGGGGSWR